MASESMLSSRASVETGFESPVSRRFTPVEFPERFKNDGPDSEEDLTAPKSRHGKYMNQSFLSVIANAGSRGNFNPHLAAGVGHDEQGPFGATHTEKRVRHARSTSDTIDRANESQKGSSKAVQGQDVWRSTPGLSYTPRRHQRRTSAHDYMAESQILPPIPATPDPASAVVSEDETTKVDSAEIERETVEKSTSTVEEDTLAPLSTQGLETSLSERVTRVFGLGENEEVTADYPCWLLQNILLKGHVYITPKHICFYAYLPKSSNTAIKSGKLSKRGHNNPNYRQYWFVLKGDLLSYYFNPSDLYFPRGTIQLRSGMSAEVTKSKDGSEIPGFQINSRQRTHYFKSDSISNAKEWVKHIQKVLFRSQNEGDSIKILLPFEQILDIEDNPVIDFADTVRVRIFDKDETFAIDEYFFSFFGYGQEALTLLRSSLDKSHGSQTKKPRKTSDPNELIDTATDADSNSSNVPDELIASTVFSNVDLSDEPKGVSEDIDASEQQVSTELPQSTVKSTSLAGKDAIQSSSSFSKLQDLVKAGAYPLQKATGIAGVLRSQSKRVGSLLATESLGYYEKVSGMWTGKRTHYDDSEALAADELTDDGEGKTSAAQYGQRFREHFSLPETEKLQAAYYCYLHRVVPVYGKLYVGTRKLCFRGLLPGSRTKMIMPMKDIENVIQEKGFRFGYSGLVVVVRGHEELFFEFRKSDARDDCTMTLLKCSDSARHLLESRVLDDQETVESKAAQLERDMLQHGALSSHPDRERVAATGIELTDDDVSPVQFDDPLATSVVNFKPPKSLRITCLTIGSRGDIQPYIALCKGLIEEGHQPRIATHPEFGPWIKYHGIEFCPVAGDPAEIMRLCVENDMFTVSFFREANSKFRGWIDQLLLSSWKACQNSDLLIESPSAMAGIHIAEALEIPYFRAFTMPWTRTRAYPHAFAVPNQKMGGNYNSFSYVMFDNVFWQTTQGQINRWRGKTLGLPPTNLEKLQVNKVPFLYNFSPSVVIPPLDFSHWIRVTGFWFLDEGEAFTPSPELAEFIHKAREDNKKIVYVGFGSVVVGNSKAMTSSVIESVIKADVRCILSKGWSERLDKVEDRTVPEVELPDCIFQIKSAPHDWLFKRIDAAAHHGGAGTTGASLRAGIPTIVKPFFGDQYFFGSRVEDLGVGKLLKTFNTTVFARALWEVTNSERIITKARELGEQIRSEDGVHTAIQAIYRDLEYAKSLIKRPQKSSEGKDESEESWTMVGDDSEGEAGGRGGDPVFQSSLMQRDLSAASGKSGSSDGNNDHGDKNDEDNE